MLTLQPMLLPGPVLRKGAGVRLAAVGIITLLVGCTTVGPDFVPPDNPLPPSWYEAERARFEPAPQDRIDWWTGFGDPTLDALVSMAQRQNNGLQIAGLRMLEARAQLGVAVGNRYPQAQVVQGGATRVQASRNGANTAAGDLRFTQYDLGLAASWELDFWGRFRRGIEAADAAYLASIAAYDDAFVLLTAQVADTYVLIRTLEEQLRITRENIRLQERGYEIVDVQFRNGESSELDVLQARTLLLSTQASLPDLDASLRRARHALSTLLGLAPGDLADLLVRRVDFPIVPDEIATGVPADLLRQRPDVRRAELQAMAQNARVGLATANLYPSFSLSGSLGLSAAGATHTTRTGDSGFTNLFSTDSFTYGVGPSFVWPMLNYGRIRNSIRIQDARLQQALVAYRETVLQAAREVEDALVDLAGARDRETLLAQSVEAARRSSDVALLRYQEGLADYQRVLSAQQSLFTQQGRFIENRGRILRSAIVVYRALGGGWELRAGQTIVDPDVRRLMESRTDWGGLIEASERDADDLPAVSAPR
ncbi:MAG: efflux transporter outer membrane subunit [Pseudomonadales bacterium]|jgi:NodT family efflux transporter outer membrane factor (OMF) lipoprotein|nr:efflux transporter outer membrane subunit [Pseudomonadales bacterium]